MTITCEFSREGPFSSCTESNRRWWVKRHLTGCGVFNNATVVSVATFILSYWTVSVPFFFSFSFFFFFSSKMRLCMCFACTDFVDLTRVRVCNPYVMRRILTTCIFIPSSVIVMCWPCRMVDDTLKCRVLLTILTDAGPPTSVKSSSGSERRTCRLMGKWLVSWTMCSYLFSAMNFLTETAAFASCFSQSSGAVWESGWPSWAFRPNEPYGFRGRKRMLTMLTHWSQFVPNMSADIREH